MVDTIRTIAALQSVLADNAAGDISAQDVRDFLVSALPTGRAATKVVVASDADSQWTAQADFTCDGTADEVQIQAAIDALPSMGGTVLLSEGNFSIDDDINIQASNITLKGCGWGTIVTATVRLAGIRIFGATGAVNHITECIVRDLKFVGSGLSNVGNNNEQTGIKVYFADDCQVLNCWVEQCPYDGILFLDETNRGQIIGNVVKQGGSGGDDGINVLTDGGGFVIANNYVSDQVSDGIHVSGGKNVSITGNVIEDCTVNGITITNVSQNTSFTCTGNVVSGSGKSGIGIGDGLDRGAFYLRGTISSNLIPSGGDGTGTEGGIHIQTTAGESTVMGDFLIANNVIKTYSGIQIRVVAASNNKITTLVLSGNIVESAIAQDAIFIQYVDEVLCIGNMVDNDSQQSIQTDNCGNSTLINNHTHGSGPQVAATNITTLATIRGNHGWKTEGSGTATVLSGQTTIAVTHGLDVTPTVEDISITFNEQGTSDYGRWWVDTITSTQFTLNVSVDPGVSNLTFGWRVAVL